MKLWECQNAMLWEYMRCGTQEKEEKKLLNKVFFFRTKSILIAA